MNNLSIFFFAKLHFCFIMEMFKMKSINRSHAGLVSFLNMIPVGYTIVLYYDYYCFIPPVVINTHNLASYDSWV